jgi:ribosomal protein L12E/L44/L45/RPP1/RPP2
MDLLRLLYPQAGAAAAAATPAAAAAAAAAAARAVDEADWFERIHESLRGMTMQSFFIKTFLGLLKNADVPIGRHLDHVCALCQEVLIWDV